MIPDLLLITRVFTEEHEIFLRSKDIKEDIRLYVQRIVPKMRLIW
jgi:hypothetical protein